VKGVLTKRSRLCREALSSFRTFPPYISCRGSWSGTAMIHSLLLPLRLDRGLSPKYLTTSLTPFPWISPVWIFQQQQKVGFLQVCMLTV